MSCFGKKGGLKEDLTIARSDGMLLFLIFLFLLINGPNHIWHLDGYDKLTPYGVSICDGVCVDIISVKIVYNIISIKVNIRC